ncbi:MAG: hypothetical protein QOK30_2284, partial [Nocardioidaceae bacterium]|nr:hypothetical protein [Nocardioidaceae bacterium]
MSGASRLEGRTAVITGGCSGIGLASARRFAAEGAHVVVGDVDARTGADVAAEVGGTFVTTDVTDAEQVEALFATAHEVGGSVDIAFNNAGISPPDDDSILDTGIDVWQRVQEVNLTSVYLCCKAALPYMRRQRRGSIINTASFVAVMGAATSQISYTASKGGVLAMSRELGVLGEELLEQRRVHRAGTQRVDADALAGELDAELARHGEHAALRGAVGDLRRRGAHHGDERRGVDDRPALLLQHVGQHRLAAQVDAGEVDLLHP